MIFFLYVLLTLLLLGAGYFLGDSTWWLALINSFRYWLFAPAILFWIEQIFEGFWEKDKTVALAVVTGIWVFLYIWFPFYENKDVAQPAEIKAMTFNILYSNQNLSEIIRVVQKARPDLVALQEVTEEQGAYLKKQLSKTYKYSSFKSVNELAGLATFSKFPLKQASFIPVKSGYAQLIKLKMPQRDIFVINLHTESIKPLDIFGAGSKIVKAYQNREQMIIDIFNFLEQKSISLDNCLILGDFNSTEGNKTYHLIKKAGLVDSYRAVNPILFNAFTFPKKLLALENAFSFVRIDYIYAGKSLQTLRSEVIQESTGSDHKPLVSSFAFN